MRAILYVFLLVLSLNAYSQVKPKVSGITLVAPRDSFQIDPMPSLLEVNCTWIAVVPYAFTPNNESKVYFGNKHQWWGESPNGAARTIELAKKNGLKVMLKPQLWIHNSWVGAMDYDTEEEWREWESSYRDYILEFAKIAEQQNVEILCIGTEFKLAVQKRAHFWKELIRDVREYYSGLITYCSNWDEFEDVTIWEEVDIIGISAYFPLSEQTHPEIDHLKKQWNPIKLRLQKLAKKYDKKILFTEYGYLSVDGCAGKTWELEKIRMQIPSNELAQSNALEALYSSFCDETYWMGGFLWKWYPNERVRERFKKHDYTPQSKISEKTIRRWFKEFNLSEE